MTATGWGMAGGSPREEGSRSAGPAFSASGSTPCRSARRWKVVRDAPPGTPRFGDGPERVDQATVAEPWRRRPGPAAKIAAGRGSEELGDLARGGDRQFGEGRPALDGSRRARREGVSRPVYAGPRDRSSPRRGGSRRPERRSVAPRATRSGAREPEGAGRCDRIVWTMGTPGPGRLRYLGRWTPVSATFFPHRMMARCSPVASRGRRKCPCPPSGRLARARADVAALVGDRPRSSKKWRLTSLRRASEPPLVVVEDGTGPVAVRARDFWATRSSASSRSRAPACAPGDQGLGQALAEYWRSSSDRSVSRGSRGGRCWGSPAEAGDRPSSTWEDWQASGQSRVQAVRTS